MRPNPEDPSTWLVEVWWPPQWRHHFYAREFEFYREFGLRLLREPGPWQMRMEAADPVATFCTITFHWEPVAELHVNSDVPEGEPWRYQALLVGGGSEIETADVGEAVRLVVKSRQAKAEDPPW